MLFLESQSICWQVLNKKKSRFQTNLKTMSEHRLLKSGNTAMLDLLARTFKLNSVLRESYRRLLEKESALQSCDSLRLYS